MNFIFFALLALSTVSAHPTSSSSFAPFSNKSSAPHQWQKQQRASPDTIIPVKIALTQQNLERGSKYLEDISDPKSPNFGKFWTPGQIKDAFAPSDESSSSVRAWLADAGISNITISANGGYLKFNAAVGQMEELLKTEYHVYKHSDSGHQHIKCNDFQLPEHVQDSIDFIAPTRSFPRTVLKRTIIPSNKSQRRAVSPGCANSITPSCIKSEHMNKLKISSRAKVEQVFIIFRPTAQTPDQLIIWASWSLASPSLSPTSTNSIRYTVRTFLPAPARSTT